MLSSVGVINNHLLSKRDGKAAIVDIEDWWLSDEIINRLLETTLWTWDGQLNLSVSYNEAFFGEGFCRTVYRWVGKRTHEGAGCRITYHIIMLW